MCCTLGSTSTAPADYALIEKMSGSNVFREKHSGCKILSRGDLRSLGLRYAVRADACTS